VAGEKVFYGSGLPFMAGIVAALMLERITRLGEQLSDWKP